MAPSIIYRAWILREYPHKQSLSINLLVHIYKALNLAWKETIQVQGNVMSGVEMIEMDH